MAQPYSFIFSEILIAENAGVSLKSMHFDAGAILKAYDGIKPLADMLGVDAPKPRLAGFGYPHVVSLGAGYEFPDDGEPNVFPIIKTPEDIDRLREPEDYLAAPLIRERLKLAGELGRRRPDAAVKSIGHPLEGPITTAVLLMGQEFLMLPYDDPKRAHRLLTFCTESALNYARTLRGHFYGNAEFEPKPHGIPDDFAGMLPPELFGEFVVPYWNRIYDGLQTTERHLHSELLREEHLPFLRDLNIKYFDPSADQYFTPALLKRRCPCAFQSRIQSWDMRDLTSEQLERLYREIAACEPYVIALHMGDMDWLPKVKRLLKLAREMA